MSANKRKIKNLYRHLKGDLKMLKPLADHIVVELTVKEEKTSSGIYLPDTASKEKPQVKCWITVLVSLLKLKLAMRLYLQNIPELNLNMTVKII